MNNATNKTWFHVKATVSYYGSKCLEDLTLDFPTSLLNEKGMDEIQSQIRYHILSSYAAPAFATIIDLDIKEIEKTKRKLMVISVIETEVEVENRHYSHIELGSAMKRAAEKQFTNPAEANILMYQSCIESNYFDTELRDKLMKVIHDHSKQKE